MSVTLVVVQGLLHSMSGVIPLIVSIIKNQGLPNRSWQRYRYLRALEQAGSSQRSNAKDVWHEYCSTHQVWAISSMLSILLATLSLTYWMLSDPINFDEATRVGVDVVVCGLPGLISWHLTARGLHGLQHSNAMSDYDQAAGLSLFFWVRLSLSTAARFDQSRHFWYRH